MKKIVYLAPALLLGLVGRGAVADQNTHISRLDAGFMTNLNESQPDQAANANKTEQEQVAQNKDVKNNETSATITNTTVDNEETKSKATSKTYENKNIAILDVNKLSDESNNTKRNFSYMLDSLVSIPNKADLKTGGTINEPANGKVIVHYIDEKGNPIKGVNDQTIRVNASIDGKYNIPNNYKVANGTGTYKIEYDTQKIYHPASTYTRNVHKSVSISVLDAGDESTGGVVNPDGSITPSWQYANNNNYLFDDQYDSDTGKSVTSYPDFKVVDYSYGTTEVDGISHGIAYLTGAYTVPVTRTNPAWTETKVTKRSFTDNGSGLINGNTVNVILKHGTKNVDIDNSDMELDSWRKVHVINSDNQSNLTNKSVKFKVGYTLDLVSLAKTANFNSSRALSDPNDFIGENNLTDPVGFSAINTKLLSISL